MYNARLFLPASGLGGVPHTVKGTEESGEYIFFGCFLYYAGDFALMLLSARFRWSFSGAIFHPSCDLMGLSHYLVCIADYYYAHYPRIFYHVVFFLLVYKCLLCVNVCV